MKTYLTIALVALIAAAAQAQPTIDGSLDAGAYGTALSTQNTRTGFGDNNSDDVVLTAAGGSEINQVYATISGDRLYVMVTGNLETNFNKLQLFFDTNTGTGVNTIDGANLPSNLDGFCCGGFSDPTGALQRMDGLTFDTGFKADSALTITNGFEKVNPELPDQQEFWAVSAHFADMTSGSSGDVYSLGMQTGPRGNNTVFRTPFDYNNDGTVNAADYTVWRDSEGATGAGLAADGNGDEIVDGIDYDNWNNNFNVDASLSGGGFNPSVDFGSDFLINKSGVALPGLSQGELIDRTYAQSTGGCSDDTGAGCVAAELEFALDVDPGEANNESSHRNFNNAVDLRLALDNSNILGVTGSGDNFEILPGDIVPGGADDATAVTTGVELSIPLSEIGATAGSGQDIRIMAFVNGNGNDWLSNQFAGIGILDANIGQALFTPTTFSLADFPGDQFVTLANPAPSAVSVPEPTALVLATLAALGLASRRK